MILKSCLIICREEIPGTYLIHSKEGQVLVVRVMLWGIGNDVVDMMSLLPHQTIMVKLTANRNLQALGLQRQLVVSDVGAKYG